MHVNALNCDTILQKKRSILDLWIPTLLSYFGRTYCIFDTHMLCCHIFPSFLSFKQIVCTAATVLRWGQDMGLVKQYDKFDIRSMNKQWNMWRWWPVIESYIRYDFRHWLRYCHPFWRRSVWLCVCNKDPDRYRIHPKSVSTIQYGLDTKAPTSLWNPTDGSLRAIETFVNFSKRLENVKSKSRGYETARDHMIIHPPLVE